MKFKDLALSGHGTDLVTKRTQPCGVWYTSRECGLGKSGAFREGGVNTATMRSPVNIPINVHNIENMLVLPYEYINLVSQSLVHRRFQSTMYHSTKLPETSVSQPRCYNPI